MSLMLNTGVMKYREDSSSSWQPLVLAANVDLVSLADAFSESATYEVGEYVRRDSKIYRCITAITTAGPWDSTKWLEVNIGDELYSLNVGLTDAQTVAKKSLSGKRVYIIGDSLNDRNGGYGQYVLSISDMVGATIGNGSSGFVQVGVGDKKFIDLLNELSDSLTTAEKNDTDYFVLMGGINDALNGITVSQETTAVETFIATAKTVFPNAEIIICPLHTFKWLTPSQYNCYAAIIDTCRKYGVRTTEDFLWWTIVDDYKINAGDDVHLTASGCEILGGLIVNYIMGGDVLRTWAYTATSSVGTVAGNSLTRKGRDFQWRIVLTSLTASLGSTYTIMAVADSTLTSKHMVWNNLPFFTAVVYASGTVYPFIAGIATGNNVIEMRGYKLADTPTSITGMSAFIISAWKVGIDENTAS